MQRFFRLWEGATCVQHPQGGNWGGAAGGGGLGGAGYNGGRDGDATGWSERVGWDVMGGLWQQGDGGGGAASYAQYVWDPRYIDAPVCRFRDSNADGSLDETLYYAQDANFNVTAVMDASGVVKERYTYDAYGKVTFRQNAWSLQAVEGSADGAASAYDNQILFGGYRFDPESGLYHVRNRPYHPTLGAWPVRDPAGYVDGMSLYEYVGTNPATLCDPFGLEATIQTAEDIATQAAMDQTHGGATQAMPVTATIAVTISCLDKKTWTVSDVNDTYVIRVRILTIQMAKSKFVKDHPTTYAAAEDVPDEVAKGVQGEIMNYEKDQNAGPISRLWNISANDGRKKLTDLKASFKRRLKEEYRPIHKRRLAEAVRQAPC